MRDGPTVAMTSALPFSWTLPNGTSMSLRDPALLRTPPPTLQCGEQWIEPKHGEPNGQDDDSDSDFVGSILFWLQLSKDHQRLEFSCRRGSVGVLEEHEVEPRSSRQEELEEATYEQVDPQFFDPGYTLAGATGFQIWAGTRLLIEALLVPLTTDCPRLQEIQRDLHGTHQHSHQEQRPTKRILELGAGIGVVGIALAAELVDAQVLLTDLPTLVDHATQWNLDANRYRMIRATGAAEAASPSPSPPPNDWFPTEPVLMGYQNNNGWAATAPLDWRIPVQEQLPLSAYSNLDYIVASDCVWLVSMLDALLNTVASIFDASASSSSSPPTLLLSFQRRDTSEGDDSPNFTTVQRVIHSVTARGWRMECLAWRPVGRGMTPPINESSTTDDHDDGDDPDEKEVFVFAIRPTHA